MKKKNNTFQNYSNVLNAKNFATMEMYAMDTHYMVNVERENHTIPPSTANSTTDVPTAVNTTHPLPEHAQSGKKKKKS